MSKRSHQEIDADDHFDTPSIVQIVKEIYEYNGTQKDKMRIFEKKYTDFKDRYPTLFELSCSSDFDFQRFQYMMKLREQVITKERTLDNASAEVGQNMFNVYVKPNLSNM